MRRVLIFTSQVLILFLAAGTEWQVEAQTQPDVSRSGIYSLDAIGGTFRDSQIRDYPFVTGYAWRYEWADIETSEDVYDFTAFDHLIGRLSEIDQKLSWLVMGGPPSYVAQKPGVETWNNEGVLTPLPWDPIMLDRYEAFIEALSQHVADVPGGSSIQLKDHPTLSLLHPSIPGAPRNGLRDAATYISDLPGYSRDKIVGATQRVLEIFRLHFPRNPLQLSLWPINDSQTSPRLYEALAEKALEFPSVGLWMDNLSASRPCVGCEPASGRPVPSFTPLTLTASTQRNGFQMLGSWTHPFNEDHVPNLLNGTPMDGMQYGLDTYGVRYFEVYASDLDNPDFEEGFVEYAALLADPAYLVVPDAPTDLRILK